MTIPSGDFGAVVAGTPAPCRLACPVGTDASAYVALFDEGRVSEAYDVARRHNPFASVCGRVCSAPCERACRRGVIDEAVSIRAIKRVVCDAFGAEQGAASRWRHPVGTIPAATGGSVGIVGGGPAGLAAAHDLRTSGFAVTVYEAQPAAGGMMRFGIPAFRLPRHVLNAEVDAIASLGVEVRVGCEVGRDITFGELLQQHQAVLVTVGCQRGRTMQVPGVDLPGVIRAVEFLRGEPLPAVTLETGSLNPAAELVVIGGGSVAFDAARAAWRARATSGYDGQTVVDVARTALRAGQTTVTMVAPEQRTGLMVPLEELREAIHEGVVLRDGFGVVRILGETCVTGVEAAPVIALHDASGRFNPQLDLDRSVVIDATAVVLAIGQESDTDFLADMPNITRTAWGGIAVDDSMQSSHPQVWAAGDVATSPRDLIDAIAAGQRAAASIMRTLGAGRSSAKSVSGVGAVPAAPPLQHRTRFWTGYEQQARMPLPVVPPVERDAAVEVERSLTVTSARVEASRCLRCDEHMQFSAVRCIACALCVDVCPQSSLSLLPSNDRTLALVFDDDSCIRCGLCVSRCPTDALRFEMVRVATAPASHGLDHAHA